MRIVEKSFTCERDGLTIRGKYYLPEMAGEKKYPCVILSHGFTGNYTDMEPFGRDFAELGYAAFVFSFCGGGSKFADKALLSDGATTDMTISTEIEDLLTVIDYAEKQSFVDGENLILLGCSQGGLVSGLTAARCGEKIKKLIMVFPALCIPEHARRGCLGGASYDPAAVPEVMECPKTQIGRKLHEDVVQMDPYVELPKYKGEVLLLQGTEDTIVDASYAIRARACYEKGQCHLQLIRNMGHFFDKAQYESFFASICQFLAGGREVLSIRVLITDTEEEKAGGEMTTKIFFTGYCENECFQGTVLPGGCDVRRKSPEGCESIRAEYTLQGRDSEGKKCNVHIVNQCRDGEWKPVVTTDSRALEWLNRADLTAVLEYGNGGPTVRIFHAGGKGIC